ncbi:glycosyltransferase family 4 protein, partial [Mesonia sp.]|uniref:glycosyltransferase family 4 protein n=1 Tax=Mesonia sp. TaxID=1960830 RepID=UPI00176137E3
FGKYAPLLVAKPDIVHIHHIQILNNTLLNFFKATKIKTIVTVRGSDVLVRPFRDNKHLKFIQNVLNKVNYIHAVAKNLAQTVEDLGKPKEKIFTIYRTVEIDEIGFSKKRKATTDFYNITTIGRVHWTKGYVDAIKALNVLKSNGVNFKYHICGGYEIDLFDELNYWIRKYKLENDIIFHGHVNNQKINELLSETDVYLQCSLTEGVPNTLLRAIHFHIPIVATNAGGIPEVFVENKHGLMVDVGDFEKIAESLQLIIEDKVTLEKYSIKEISASKEINAYKNMYTKLLDINTF